MAASFFNNNYYFLYQDFDLEKNGIVYIGEKYAQNLIFSTMNYF